MAMGTESVQFHNMCTRGQACRHRVSARISDKTGGFVLASIGVEVLIRCNVAWDGVSALGSTVDSPYLD